MINNLRGSTGVSVLGMHRSGTSAFSGLLAACGYNMGKDLFGPQQGVNERGFFENAGIVALNESMLDRLQAQWDQPLPLDKPETLLQDGKVNDTLERFLLDQYWDSPFWGMKDPRSSILEPLWSSAVKRLEATYRCVLICRDPLKVADSLARRDRFTPHKSLMLWMNYNLRSVEAIARDHSAVITYEQLMAEPTSTLERVLASLELPSFDHEAIKGCIVNSMDRSSRIQQSPEPLTSLAETLYEELRGGTPNNTAVTEIQRRYREYIESMSPALTDHLARITRSEIHYRHLFYEAYDSWWWRASAPLRWLDRKLHRRAAAPKPPPRY